MKGIRFGGFMRDWLVNTLLLCSAAGSFAQLTREQKSTDFKAIVGLYDKNYGLSKEDV
jgi:hypothetical protein